jgi:hypothetical protein
MSTQRTINRSLIIHKDFALGFGQVQQDRAYGTITLEQKIELVWIFRTLDEIRYLDWSLYTRVSLHTEGPLVEYYFDSTSTASDDADDVLAPLPVITTGRWLKVNPHAPNYATADLVDIANAVNTSNAKQAGFMIWNYTLDRPLWAVGSGDSDIWVDANGTTVHTPS